MRGDELEAGDALADALAQLREERQRRARGSRARDQRGRLRPRLRKELQHRGGDDAERALGADEEVLQVVAGVVLAKRAQSVPDARRRAARPRGPAPARACCRSEARRCRPRWWKGCRRSRSCLRPPAKAGRGGRARRPPAAASRARSPLRPSSCCWRRSTRAHAVHAREVHHDLPARCVGDGAAAQARVAALRDHAPRAPWRASARRARPRPCSPASRPRAARPWNWPRQSFSKGSRP